MTFWDESITIESLTPELCQTACDKWGSTILHGALSDALLLRALEIGTANIDGFNKLGRKPLDCWIIDHNRPRGITKVKMLLEYGADPNLKQRQNDPNEFNTAAKAIFCENKPGLCMILDYGGQVERLVEQELWVKLMVATLERIKERTAAVLMISSCSKSTSTKRMRNTLKTIAKHVFTFRFEQ